MRVNSTDRSVILLLCLGATPPPASLRALSMRIPLACCLLSCVLDVDLFHFFFSSFPFSILSISIWIWFVSSCLFLAGTMLSPRFRFLLRLVQHTYDMHLETYQGLHVGGSHQFIFVWGIRFSSVMYYLPFFICFPPEVIFPSRVTGACPVTTDCIVATS